MRKVCDCLDAASQHAASPLQQEIIQKYIESFRTGTMDYYKHAQKLWVKDSSPTVEAVFGFVEPYRDPFGQRAEFEALVAIKDEEETQVLSTLVNCSAKFIRRLPWAENQVENDGKGPFEKSLFEAPDFVSLHGDAHAVFFVVLVLTSSPALVYCSSILFPGINLPNVSICSRTGAQWLMDRSTTTFDRTRDTRASCSPTVSSIKTWTPTVLLPFYHETNSSAFRRISRWPTTCGSSFTSCSVMGPASFFAKKAPTSTTSISIIPP